VRANHEYHGAADNNDAPRGAIFEENQKQNEAD
jgi:hypothetical protein